MTAPVLPKTTSDQPSSARGVWAVLAIVGAAGVTGWSLAEASMRRIDEHVALTCAVMTHHLQASTHDEIEGFSALSACDEQLGVSAFDRYNGSLDKRDLKQGPYAACLEAQPITSEQLLRGLELEERIRAEIRSMPAPFEVRLAAR